MKFRILALIISLVLIFSLVACNSSKEDNSEDEKETSTTVPVTTDSSDVAETKVPATTEGGKIVDSAGNEYVADRGELEIMTNPANNSSNTQSSNENNTPKAEVTTDSVQSEVVPGYTFSDENKIELPFVPAG